MSTKPISYNGVEDIHSVVDYFMAHDEQLINNPVFTESANVDILKQSLHKILSKVDGIVEFEEMLNYKQLIYVQLIHYCDTIEQIEGLEADLHELMVHRIYLGTELKILNWIFVEKYNREADLSNKSNASPQGFLRYLKLNCKPEVTAHFIGLALQQFLRTQYENEPFYQDENFFVQSYNYLVELVLETDEMEKLFKIIHEQREELTWLRDIMISCEYELQKNPDNEVLKEKQAKAAADFMTEKLEMEFLSSVILRLF